LTIGLAVKNGDTSSSFYPIEKNPKLRGERSALIGT